jgi:hypothetical protein
LPLSASFAAVRVFRQARSRSSGSRSGAPFLMFAGIYGGGGYLALIANRKAIVGFEAPFEFGGVFAFSFGPSTGIARLTLGMLT